LRDSGEDVRGSTDGYESRALQADLGGTGFPNQGSTQRIIDPGFQIIDPGSKSTASRGSGSRRAREAEVLAELAKQKAEEHVTVDSKRVRFLEQHHIVTYFTGENRSPVKILKAPMMVQSRPRPIEPVKDNREGIRIHFGDQVSEGKKSDGANHRLIFDRAHVELKVPRWWGINQLRQEEEGPKIVVEAIRWPNDQPPAEEIGQTCAPGQRLGQSEKHSREQSWHDQELEEISARMRQLRQQSGPQ
jgi:hypothetical protein